jgi:hypothetical protein
VGDVGREGQAYSPYMSRSGESGTLVRMGLGRSWVT